MAGETSKRIGRPPEGSGKGGEPERIRDYPKLLVTIRPTVRKKLKATASVEGRAAWQIVEDALAMYMDKNPSRRITQFCADLRSEIKRRREAANYRRSRAHNQWSPDNVNTVELCQLIDWIENELDKLGTINPGQSANVPKPAGPERKPAGK